MRLIALVKKEFRQFRRDRRMVALSVVAPLLQLILLGYAANLDVVNLPMAVCDQDLSGSSARLVAEIEQSAYFVLVAHTVRADDLSALLDRGAVRLALQIPYGFEADLREGRAQVQILVDGSDANTAGLGTAYLSGIVGNHGIVARSRQIERVGGMPVSLPRLQSRPRVLYNPSLESVYYMVPGVMGVVLMVITGMLTALAIVKEREVGTLEQVMVTPVRRWEVILGKLIPYTVVGTVDLALVLTVMLLWFQVPLHGSLAFLIACAMLYILTCLGLGLLASTVSVTQHQAQMTMFLLMMPMMLLSGFMFPIANMPHWLQPLTYLMPLRYFLVIIRSVMLKSSGPVELWPQVAALALFGVVLISAGVLLFRKRL